MSVIAIDPGTTESAMLELDDTGTRVIIFDKMRNELLLAWLMDRRRILSGASHLAIEMIASYGMAVGREVFETCVWIGRFVQAWDGPHTMVYRREVKGHLCGTPKATDSNVRKALIDLFGGEPRAVGKKKTPGPLYGITKDVWAALGVAITWHDANLRDAGLRETDGVPRV